MGGTLPRVSAGLAGVTALCAGVVVAGWASGLELLTTGVADATPTKLTTALCLVALAACLVVPRRGVRVGLALAVVVAVVATLLQYPLGIDLGIDEALVQDTISSDGDPGRMALTTGVALLVLAGAQLALLAGRYRWVEGLGLLTLAVGATATFAHLLSLGTVYDVPAFATMALPTAVMLMMLAVGHLALVPDGLVPWTVADPGPGARLVRRFVPIALVALPALGWLRITLVDADVLDERSGVALVLTAFAALILATTYRVARRLDAEAAEAAAAREALNRLNEQLVEGRDAAWQRAEDLARDLAEERARFERSLARTADLFWTIEVLPEGLELVYASPNARGLFGGDLPADSNPVAAMRERVHPDDDEARAAFAARVMAGEPADTELRLVGLDGVVRSVWARGLPRREGERLFCDGITTDVTERRALADQREALLVLERDRVEQLRNVGRMRDEFISVAGHELRTPLTAIQGYATLLLGDERLTPEQERALRVIVNRSEQVTELIGEFFEVAKLNAGMTRLPLGPLDLATVVHEVAQEHQAVAAEAGVTLTADVLPCPVLGDAAALRRVLDKLLDNAIRYTPAGGRVRVVTRRAHDRAVAQVVDSGIGISPDQVAQVFDHLFNGTSPQARGADGRRIGLAVTRALVEAHGGSIQVAPGDGGGTVFTVELPLHGAAEPTTPDPDSRAAEPAEA